MERVFKDVRAAFPTDFNITERRNVHLSQGILSRLRDAWTVRRFASEVNHVTGDVHYLTYFLPGNRTVLTIHDTVLVDRERGLKRFLLWFFWFWLPGQKCGHITTISNESKQRILALIKFPPERIFVIPNPVSPHFSQKPMPKREGPFRLLHIGTKLNKNLENLIPAIEGLDVELTIIGCLTDRQKELLHQHSIQFRNTYNLADGEIHDEYTRAEALTFVSVDEGFGLPIVEAQATGRPVITSQRAPMNEVAGDGALLVEPENVEAIREAVLKVILDNKLRSQLIERGIINAQRFSAVSVAASYAKLYHHIHKGLD